MSRRNRLIAAVFGVFSTLAALPSFSRAADPAQVQSPGVPTRCDAASRLCWWVDGGQTLHAVRFESPLTPLFIQRIAQDPVSEDAVSAEVGNGLSPLLSYGMQQRYTRLRAKLSRSWSVAARSIVSDTVHADMQTLARAAYDVTTAWTEAISIRVNRDTNAHNDARMMILGPAAMTLVYAVPVAPIIQNYVFYAILKYAIPAFFESADYAWTATPIALSASIQDLEVSRLKGEIAAYTDYLLSRIALDYLMSRDGEQRLEQDSQDQGVQIAQLTEYGASPMGGTEAQAVFRDSRDFRLIYAAKMATVLNEGYSEAINNFIVTGYFGELAWASTGAMATESIFDLYLPQDAPKDWAPSYANPFGDHRRKRLWSIGPLGLQAKDQGAFIVGRGLDSALLILPYWDEAVRPRSASGPILSGNPKVAPTFWQ